MAMSQIPRMPDRAIATPHLSGFLNVYKPAGARSTAVVGSIRRATGARRVGHCGTLDPLAEGVLPLAVGRATRLAERVLRMRKSYVAGVLFGVATTTDDLEGAPLGPIRAPPDPRDVVTELAAFTGRIRQRPPAASAIHVNGRRAYQMLRAGETVELPEREVTVHRLDVVDAEPIPLTAGDSGLSFRAADAQAYGLIVGIAIECSSGTYVRSIARDLGDRLGCGATLFTLTRTAVGPFTLAGASEVWQVRDACTRGYLDRLMFAPDTAVGGLPACVIGADTRADLRHGRESAAPAWIAGEHRIYAADGEFVGVGHAASGRWRRWQVFTEIA